MITMLTLLAACSGGEDPAAHLAAVRDAESKLRQGDLTGASAAYDAALAQFPEQVEVVVGASYLAYARGDFARADGLLAGIEPQAGDKLGEVKLRRALVALQTQSADAVMAHALASGTPAGQVLAAEVALVDGDRAKALELLQQAAGGDDYIAQTAQRYTQLLQHGDASVAALAENYALWAVGKHKMAVTSVEQVVASLPLDYAERPDELLLWAGRAAALKETQVASNLLEAIDVPPAGQLWRVKATRAIIACAEGLMPECIQEFGALSALAPPDGLIHARATAVMVMDPQFKAEALTLLGNSTSDAAARAALVHGEVGFAREMASDSLFSQYLASR